MLTFQAPLKRNEENSAHYITMPEDIRLALGGGGRIPVIVTYDGHEYRGTAVRYGTKELMLLILKSIFMQLGKQAGDMITVTIERDEEKRTVEVPADLQALLNETPTALHRFEKLSYTHRKEYVKWIEEAKRPETRQSRLEKTLVKLLEPKP